MEITSDLKRKNQKMKKHSIVSHKKKAKPISLLLPNTIVIFLV